MDLHEMARGASDPNLTWVGAAVAGGSSAFGFIDNTFVGIFASAITLGGFAFIGVYVAWIDRVTKARIKADDDESSARIRRQKEYEAQCKDMLQEQLEHLRSELAAAREAAKTTTEDRNFAREELADLRQHIRELRDETGEHEGPK